MRTAANAEVNPDGNIENTNNNDGDNINNNNYSNSNDNNSNKSTVDTVAKTMISTTMQHQQQQQQQLAQSRSESWAVVHANLQNPAASSQLGSIEDGKSGPLTRLSFESVNDERRRYQQNYDQFVSQQQISQMTVNQELYALHLSQRQQQQLAQSRSESWAAVRANPQNPAASSQFGSIEYGKPDPLTRLSIESVNDERRRYQQNYDQFVSQQQISQMTVNQELSALYLSQRQRELEQQQLLLLQQQDQQRQQQQQQQQQNILAMNAAIVQQIQQLQQQQLQLQQMQQMRQMQQMQTQQKQTSPRDGKKKSSYDDLGMIEDAP